MAQLQIILDRLIAENLQGSLTKSNPASAATISYPPLATRALRRTTNSQGDLHATFQRENEDPRWPNLFEEFFLVNSDNTNDDLLFFVRQPNPQNEDLDPVFVKRKSPQPHVMPSLDEAVLWKETFFLNLIVQLPCKLTVAVCTRTTTEADGDGTSPKTSMRCSSKYVSKRVYALPTKSRMDIKEASMECSYPLIYYVIDDYEEMFEHLNVSKEEYLCVELAVTIPRKSDIEEDTEDNDSDDEKYYISHKTRKNRRSMTDGPFPQPCSGHKITLFQGAAPYSSLLDIYKQKAANKLNPRFKMGPIIPPTEYVMMRGPSGRGHAQVAITALPTEENIDELSNSELPLPSLSSTAASFFGSINNTRVDNNVGSNREKITNNLSTSSSSRPNSSSLFFQSLRRLSQFSITDRGPSEPESLKCCMTFVHIHWTNIISDLLEYAKKNTT